MGGERSRIVRRPPLTVYWLLADPGEVYVAYGRGVANPVSIKLGNSARGSFEGFYWNPRTGVTEKLGEMEVQEGQVRWRPPVTDDWVLTLKRSK